MARTPKRREQREFDVAAGVLWERCAPFAFPRHIVAAVSMRRVRSVLILPANGLLEKAAAMQRGNRKSAPCVVRGRVQKKNNWHLSPDYYRAPDPRAVIVDRRRPGAGYRHVLTKSDIYRFLELLPDWNNLAVGLNGVVLAPGSQKEDGWHVPGVVHICAWNADLWIETSGSYYAEHCDIFERLGVASEEVEDGYFLCKFDEAAVRGYQLLHILLHELGHHHDRMTTRSQRRASRGEKYAEAYARLHEAALWQQYQRAFRL